MSSAPVFHRLAVSLRPGRVAVFVPDEESWMPKAMRCIEVLTRTWGGAADLLLPRRQNDEVAPVFWRILSAFDPDWIGHYDQTLRGRQMADPEGVERMMTEVATKWVKEHGGTVDEAKRSIFRDTDMTLAEDGVWQPSPALARRLDDWLAPHTRGTHNLPLSFRADSAPDSQLVDMADLADLPMPLLALDTSALPEPMRLIIATRVGAVAPSYEKELLGRGITAPRLVADRSDVPPLLQLVWRRMVDPTDWAMHKVTLEMEGRPIGDDPLWTAQDFTSQSPLGWTTLGTTWTYNMRRRRDDPPFVLVIGDALADFCLGYDLDRLLGTAAWLPTAFVGDGDDLQRQVVTEIASVLIEAERSNRALIVTSTSLTATALTEAHDVITSNMRFRLRGPEQFRAVPAAQLEIPEPWRLYGRGRTEQFRHEAFIDGQMAGDLETPQPLGVSGRTPDSVTWQVDVRIDDYSWPVRSAIGSLLGSASGWAPHIRPSVGGTTYFSHTQGVVFGGTPLEQRLTRARLRFPTAEAMFDALLARGQLTADDSDAGRFTRGTLTLFGGLANLTAAFKEPSSTALLDAYRLRVRRSGPSGDYLNALDRRFLSFDHARTVTQLADADLRPLIDHYLERGILWRGLALQCPVCRYAGWYRLAELDQQFRCARCRAASPLSRRTWKTPIQEPTWHYELDEIVFQAVSRDLRAPILAVDRLRGESGDFQFAPERDVRDARGQLLAEIDLWVILDGRLIIGEAKTTDRLAPEGSGEQKIAGRLVAVAEAVTADELVLATTAPAWQPTTREAVESRLAKSSIKARFIEGL